MMRILLEITAVFFFAGIAFIAGYITGAHDSDERAGRDYPEPGIRQ